MLTALYVPADRPDRFGKAVAAGPDLVILDLEDAVPVAAKAAAREHAASWLREHPSAEVRVNAVGSPWIADDLAALKSLGPVRVRLPKVEHPSQLREVAGALPEASITCLLESPLGVERAFDIASAGVAGVTLGEADLSSALGVDTDEGLAWCRGRIVAASRAAGLGAPMMSVYPHLRDPEGLRRSCAVGRSLGFTGRAAIHPEQLPIIRAAFTPPPDQLDRARALLAAVSAAGIADGGVLVLPDGRMVDPAMIARAREVLTQAR